METITVHSDDWTIDEVETFARLFKKLNRTISQKILSEITEFAVYDVNHDQLRLSAHIIDKKENAQSISIPIKINRCKWETYETPHYICQWKSRQSHLIWKTHTDWEKPCNPSKECFNCNQD